MGTLLVSILILCLLLFWCYQFVLLMMMEDEMFPGRHDKAIWGACFIFLSAIAPFVFLVWRRSTVALRK